jgi:hypothetical protein
MPPEPAPAYQMDFFERCLVVLTVVGSLGVIAVVIWMKVHRVTTAPSAWTVWKYAMWDSGCKLPTQLASGQSRCFCGAVIDIKGMSQHVHVAHMEAA